MGKMESVEELTRIASEAQNKLWEIEAKGRREANGSKIGKTFRTQNSYSCPERPSDYWWLYAKVTRMDDGGMLFATTFQTDKNGQVTVEYDRCIHHGQYYSACPAGEFNKAWQRLLKKLASTFQ